MRANAQLDGCPFLLYKPGAVLRGGGRGAPPPPMKNVPPVAPHFGPASLDFHLNRPVISLIQLHIVAPPAPSWNCGPPIAPIWLVPESPLVQTLNFCCIMRKFSLPWQPWVGWGKCEWYVPLYFGRLLESSFLYKNSAFVSYASRVMANFMSK